MARKNSRAVRPQNRRRAVTGSPVRSAPPPVPLEALVVPHGRCYRNSRNGKLRFSADEAEKALRQAQQTRARKAQAYHEERAYECKISEGGCGDWHLTSRKEWTPRRTA
jgi:hypothetical protein